MVSNQSGQARNEENVTVICFAVVHITPWERSIRYVSQERFICHRNKGRLCRTSLGEKRREFHGDGKG